MSIFPGNFNGYLKIENDTFVYNVNNCMVTLHPAHSDYSEQCEMIERIKAHNTALSEFFEGTYNGYKIAILRNTALYTSVLGLNQAIQFSTPLIIKAVGNMKGFSDNLTDSWDKFHSICFYGGNINSIYTPKIALDNSNDNDAVVNPGVREIKTRPFDDYTHIIDCIIEGEKVELTITVAQYAEKDATDTEPFRMGELDSCIRLSFEKAQSFESIEKYYVIIKSLIALLTLQNNIHFNVSLGQRQSNGYYYKTAECQIDDRYLNYSTKPYYRVIPIFRIKNYLQKLIDALVKEKIVPILEVLPSNNNELNRISITDVQNICTALEAVYELKREEEKRPKDSDIKELKNRIKRTVNQFIEDHPQLDVQKQTTISSAFKYLDFNLKNKIITLYKEHQEVVNTISSLKRFPSINSETIESFVKLRNCKTHSGAFEWGDNAKLYPVLLILVYAELFQYIGLSTNEIIGLLERVF